MLVSKCIITLFVTLTSTYIENNSEVLVVLRVIERYRKISWVFIR